MHRAGTWCRVDWGAEMLTEADQDGRSDLPTSTGCQHRDSLRYTGTSASHQYNHTDRQRYQLHRINICLPVRVNRRKELSKSGSNRPGPKGMFHWQTTNLHGEPMGPMRTLMEQERTYTGRNGLTGTDILRGRQMRCSNTDQHAEYFRENNSTRDEMECWWTVITWIAKSIL